MYSQVYPGGLDHLKPCPIVVEEPSNLKEGQACELQTLTLAPTSSLVAFIIIVLLVLESLQSQGQHASH